MPGVLGEVDLVRLAVDVSRQVFGRPAQLEQRLLEPAALGGVHDDRVVVDLVAEHPGQLLALGHLDQHHPVGGLEHQAVGGVVEELQPAVAVHRLGDVDQQRVRHGIAGELDQRVDHALGVVAGGPGVPQTQRGQSIGVHVLR
jgi:hypothetical protein